MNLSKFRNYFLSAAAAAMLLTMPCFAEVPENQNCTPTVKTVQEQKLCSIHNVSLGMSEDEVRNTLGAPSFKNKRKTAWHYRSVSGGVRGQSDPQVKFENKTVKSVIGSTLNLNGKIVLQSKDSEENIEKALGPCPNKFKGVSDDILIYAYPEHKLQIVTQKGRIMVMGLGVE
ncbi:hypothetical protein IJT93_00110 [bacterium]|nr:hypothetical protein [bacterium]